MLMFSKTLSLLSLSVTRGALDFTIRQRFAVYKRISFPQVCLVNHKQETVSDFFLVRMEYHILSWSANRKTMLCAKSEVECSKLRKEKERDASPLRALRQTDNCCLHHLQFSHLCSRSRHLLRCCCCWCCCCCFCCCCPLRALQHTDNCSFTLSHLCSRSRHLLRCWKDFPFPHVSISQTFYLGKLLTREPSGINLKTNIFRMGPE